MTNATLMPKVVHRDATLLGVASDERQRLMGSQTASWAHCSNAIDEFVELGFRHFECRQQLGAHDPIAQQSDSVLCAQLDRRTPDDDFLVADVDVPPACGSPLGGHIVADALVANVEDQRLPARPTGVEAREVACVVRLELVRCWPESRAWSEKATWRRSAVDCTVLRDESLRLEAGRGSRERAHRCRPETCAAVAADAREDGPGSTTATRPSHRRTATVLWPLTNSCKGKITLAISECRGSDMAFRQDAHARRSGASSD